MKNNLPKISLITVCYNAKEYIEETILSVIEQNYSNLEYIIIDGNSNDGTKDILNKYKDYFSYFVSEEDNGITHALIKGFNFVSGEILSWLNADDKLMPNALNYVANFYMKKKFDLLYGDAYYINSKNEIIYRFKSLYTNLFLYKRDIVIFCQPAVFFSKEIFFYVGGLNPLYTITMDGDLFTRILSNSNKVYRTNQVLAMFRIHDKQSTSWAIKNRYYFELKLRKSNVKKTKTFFRILFRLFFFILRLLNLK